MLKKSLLILVCVATVNTTHGWWFGGGDSSEKETDYIPYFNKKIVDDITLDEARILLPVLETFIKEIQKSKIEWDNRLISIVKTDHIEDSSSPCLAYRNTIITRLQQAKANRNALQAQINCYLELVLKEDAQEDPVDQADTPNQDINHDSDAPVELDLTQEHKEVRPAATAKALEESEASLGTVEEAKEEESI